MTLKHKQQLAALTTECNVFNEQMNEKLCELCNNLDFHQASKLSRIIDKLDLFIKELNEF